MNKYLRKFLFVLTLLLACFSCSKNPEEIGEYAPKDAYLKGSKHPYYGSENAWDQRFFSPERTKRLYKRRGQRAMLDIVKGKPEKAAKYCEKLLAADPGDLEAMFNLVVAQTQIQEIDSAFETMKQAVAAGLPFSRFLAGPRDLLKPLTENEKFKKYAAEHSIQLLHGPMLGCLTDHSAKFWVRTLDEVSVQVIVSTSNKLTRPIKSNVHSTNSTRDYTTTVAVNGLKPNTEYYYDVLLDGKTSLKPKYPSFRTYPSKGSKAHFKVGFGGGAGYVPEHERMWDVIKSHEVSAFLFLGDNVYLDLPQKPNAFHYYTYYRRQSRPEFRRLVASTSIYAIWDDHDAGMDDIWMGPYRDKPVWKLPLFYQFEENWNNPPHGNPDWPGGWFSFSIADVDFFMLECRLYRTNPYDKNPSMLGPVQKAWLLNQVKQSKATFKVLISSVPWAFSTKGLAHDTWNGFHEERKEIFDFLTDNKIDGVILLSADRHRSDAWRIERPNDYPLYEFESSRLTNQHKHELMPGALFGYNQKQSFGLLIFDTTKPDPTVTYQIISIDNEMIHSLTIKKSEISQ
ncbi:MAG: alkaline phosphatase [Calditrichaeota bacterium]|nr:alkaline phosphatase [Calditrichota bacterium]